MCTKGISYFALQITHAHISLHNFWILEQKGIRENESKKSIIIIIIAKGQGRFVTLKVVHCTTLGGAIHVDCGVESAP